MVLHRDKERNNKLIDKSRMMGDYQVRFCERVEAIIASALLDFFNFLFVSQNLPNLTLSLQNLSSVRHFQVFEYVTLFHTMFLIILNVYHFFF